MSLPPGFLEELRTRTTLSSVVGRKVVWDRKKTNAARGDFWAPCPFHQEKTASFHVDDRKGFYYCFGCHAKGDAVSFLRETGTMSFMEAVEVLARDAGMQMPARDPGAAEKADRLAVLASAMDEAVKYYRLQLRTQGGAAAREYLARRKLTEAAIDRFEIGFAPDLRQGLFAALKAKGIAPDVLVEAGLCAAPEEGKGGEPYDRFRDRIIFPIRDARGRCIGLGGRAMSADARAKYLNSPETPLFDKGRSLYNIGPAREAAGRGQTLILAEGYMDVIALSEAGFGAAVAPLGTAVTEAQLQAAWRIHPEPVVALDGDKAGIRAAMRLVDLALPLVGPGRTLRFAILPEGMDPDDLIKGRGPEAMRAVLDGAEPMVRLLWRRETEGRPIDSPERRAALDKSLREAIRRIADPGVRAHYGEEIRQLRADLFGQGRSLVRPGPPRGKGAGRAWPHTPAMPLAGTKGSILAGSGPSAEVADHLREAMILAILLAHPTLLREAEASLERAEFRDPGHEALRHALLKASHEAPAEFVTAIRSEAPDALEKLLSLAHVRIAPPVRPDADPVLAAQVLARELRLLTANRSSNDEVIEAMIEMEGLADESITWRITRSNLERASLEKENLDGGSSEVEVADNGVAVRRDERVAFRSLTDGIVFEKKKQR